MRLILATRNAHKLEELRALFSAPELEMEDAHAVPGAPDVEEVGVTFTENAVLKAEALAHAANGWAMADDSGLEVDALNGEPGVRSARYAGAHGDHPANIARVLEGLKAHPLPAARTARFVCALALARPDFPTLTLTATCEGVIAPAPRGTGGFGYDPIFIPEGHARTFGEMSNEEKNLLSHRGRALRLARERWLPWLVAWARRDAAAEGGNSRGRNNT
ncbi:MAG: RdgB/HAM1 family non-canonical purine NTP pyrophosphatase [Kiritimatiellae bacterium]|nr:RdgB/HAM1 family non-canonical purine NTP pyrophosphatase [Kiritimatiellia bacterium]